jgi:hypothetical protein
MPSIKISQLPVTQSILGSELVMMVQSGVNKNITISNLFNNINTTLPIRFNTENSPQSFSVGSALTDNLLFVDGALNRIGINTNSPTQPLHINGNIRVDGIMEQPVEYLKDASFDPNSTLGFIPSNPKSISINTPATLLNHSSEAVYIELTNGINGMEKTVTNLSSETVNMKVLLATGLSNVFLPGGNASTIVLKFFNFETGSGLFQKWVILSYTTGVSVTATA